MNKAWVLSQSKSILYKWKKHSQMKGIYVSEFIHGEVYDETCG